MSWRILILIIIFATPIGKPGFSEELTPFPQFEAKRVKPPKPGQTKRINVQIEPLKSLQAPVENQSTSATTAPTIANQNYAWFWDTISPDVSASGPGRLEPALNRLGNPPQGTRVRTPRLSRVREIVQAHGVEILKATVGTQVSPALVVAVISVESSGNNAAVSGAGAQGLMQLMPATAERFGVQDSLAAAQNIQGGVRFLDFLMSRFERDPILVLAGYNAGENAVKVHAGVPPFAETRDYVPKVLAAYTVARALCMTPPELVTDGCVFQMQ
ncbi:lytic transglycosylase domain-containing protein [Pseudopelagicola sp. nBUS_20]|uniref:lytic transglycosylase domain-containing protein n=1 Tax=Pseudopelagicola sp. nBUS_20 TaxID=3395317 RepID=UPI003EBB12DA